MSIIGNIGAGGNGVDATARAAAAQKAHTHRRYLWA